MSALDTLDILATKRDGKALPPDAIEAFVERYVAGELEDYHAAVFLTSVFIHGLDASELEALTRAMLASGDRFRFPGLPTADKHSTGGVGDKVSLPLAPAVAACGVHVPMISGRGLGHTGGTLDKLESIPGLSTALDEARFREAVTELGLAFGGQTERLVPADKRLYALRDATGLVASIPLIASSILSKKLAEGLDALVLDIKTGSGAFLVDPERGRELGETMVALAERLGLRASYFQTAMDRPVGLAYGNALEVAESIDCLRGSGPRDLRELVQTLGGAMLVGAGAMTDEFAARTRIGACLDDGSALERWLAIVEYQGGDPATASNPERLERAPAVHVVEAERDGYVAWRDVQALGRTIVELGGGRRKVGEAIDPRVGVVARVTANERVTKGQPLFEVHHASRGLEPALARLEQAYALAERPRELAPLIVDPRARG
ncbi:MAG: thymidine phosphorylase [Planctomycetota bacterium]